MASFCPSHLTAGLVLIAAGTLTSSGALADEPPASNIIEFHMELQRRGGVVRCGLFDQKGWLKDARASDTVTAKAGKVRCTFRNIPSGSYGISAFHDRNNNGKLDTNLVGYPTEEYCASRNARNLLSAPSFSDASFAYRGGLKKLEALMK